MARINTRAAGPALLTNAAATKFTVATGEKYIITHIRVANGSGVTVNFTASIGADAAGTRIFDAVPIPPGGMDFPGPYTMESAEILQAFAATTNVMTLTVDGQRSVLS